VTFGCRCKDSVRHHDVKVNGGYTFGLASFESLREFVQHFDKKPIVAGESGEKMVVIFVSLLFILCCFQCFEDFC